VAENLFRWRMRRALPARPPPRRLRRDPGVRGRHSTRGCTAQPAKVGVFDHRWAQSPRSRLHLGSGPPLAAIGTGSRSGLDHRVVQPPRSANLVGRRGWLWRHSGEGAVTERGLCRGGHRRGTTAVGIAHGLGSSIPIRTVW